MTGTDVLCGLVVAVGLAGILVPVLPGTLLVAVGILLWALSLGTAAAWTVFAVAALLMVAGVVLKYAVPGRLKAAVPTRTLVVGGLCAIVGFFVVPVVGMLVGFPLGVYAAERARLGPGAAWPSTRAALQAMGLSILIELAAALAATSVWVVGLVVA